MRSITLLVSEIDELRALFHQTANALSGLPPGLIPVAPFPTAAGRFSSWAEELEVWGDVLVLLSTSTGVIFGHRVNRRSFSRVGLNPLEADRLRLVIHNAAAALRDVVPEQARKLAAWEFSIYDIRLGMRDP